MLKDVKCSWPAMSDDRIKMRQCPYTLQVICELSVKGRKWHKMRSLSKIKTKFQKVFTKQLSLVNLAVMSIIMNYLPKSDGKNNA